MKISKICIENFRLLRNFSIDLEDELSLIIGKNNTGKTSILVALDKFLNHLDKNKFSFDDFNIEFKKELKLLIEEETDIIEEDFKPVGIKLSLFIQYSETDNLSNLNRVMMDLDPDNNVIVLGFEYTVDHASYLRIRSDFKNFKATEESKVELYKKINKEYVPRGIYYFLQNQHTEYFLPHRKSFEYQVQNKSVNYENYIDLIKEEISVKDIINFKFISAKREVTNKEIDKTLSGQTSRIYKRTEASDEQNKAVDDFKSSLSDTDSQLSEIYKSLFSEIITKVKTFGGIKVNESEIEIVSTLQHRELLEGNTTVVYKHDDENKLPEHYNGLGYMNLISMIFEIEILVQDFKREKDKRPADINLLLIEEPEAHTHPQMQYIFIKNIKKLLRKGIKRQDGQNRSLQYIISTHSACIVADSDFDDIKYLKKDASNGIQAKNLRDLRVEYDTETTQYQFLKQYLTISRAEVFFAEKAILIEGDTERILVPTFMRKIDIEEGKKTNQTEVIPLLAQNISIIEVGAHSQIFEKFIEFLGIKTLIITDIDTVDATNVKCKVDIGANYSNEAIRFFFNGSSLDDLKRYTIAEKTFNKVNKKWVNQTDGRVCVVYQTLEDGYNARSFEDSFIHTNKSFVNDKKDEFMGLQNRKYFEDAQYDAYKLADECIKKKTHFAMDILYHSDIELSNWKTPAYIEEGLIWLRED